MLRQDGTRPAPDDVRRTLLRAVGADPQADSPVAPDPGQATDALRVAYRRALLGLAGRDLTGRDGVEEVAGELADLAAATVEAALAVARGELPAGAAPTRLAVIGMGKCGGRELNYVSDVDVVFVAAAASTDDPERTPRPSAPRWPPPPGWRPGSCGSARPRPPRARIWPVDAALRPEGKAGPLVRTLASHLAYYQRWAKTWEFQALLKARPIAGDLALGHAYVEAVAPMVWAAAAREHFVEDVQAMRRRVEDHVPAEVADRQLKLGPGGLRDVEFAVQLLQLVHGRTDESLRSATTLDALRGAGRRWLRRARRRGRAERRLPVPAHPRAPHPAAPAAPYPRGARARGRPAPARAGRWGCVATRSPS